MCAKNYDINKYQYVILISIAFYRLNDCLIKLVTDHLAAFEILFFRSLFTLLFIPLFFLFTKINIKTFLENFTEKHLLLRNILAVVSLFFEVSSLEYLSLTTFILILYSAPVFIKIFAWIILKEEISLLDIIVILISSMGMLLIFNCSVSEESGIGMIYATSGAITYALACVITKKIRHVDSNSIYLSYVLVLFLISLLNYPDVIPTHHELGILFAMAVIHVAAFLLYLKGFFHLKTSRAAVLEYTGLIFALGFDYVFWNHLPLLKDLAGGALIFSGSLISIYREPLFKKMGFFKNDKSISR